MAPTAYTAEAQNVAYTWDSGDLKMTFFCFASWALISVKKTTKHFFWNCLKLFYKSFLTFKYVAPLTEKPGYIGSIANNSPNKILQKKFDIEEYIALRRRNRSESHYITPFLKTSVLPFPGIWRSNQLTLVQNMVI